MQGDADSEVLSTPLLSYVPPSIGMGISIVNFDPQVIAGCCLSIAAGLEIIWFSRYLEDLHFSLSHRIMQELGTAPPPSIGTASPSQRLPPALFATAVLDDAAPGPTRSPAACSESPV
jgi:hypothetical protein